MRRVTAASIACIVASACSDSPGAPRLAVEYNPIESFDSVILHWTRPVGEASGGYAIEARKVPEPFSPLRTVDFTKQSLIYTFDPGAPEMSDFEFRVRALPENGELRASNPIQIHRGLRRPHFTDFHVNNGFLLQWTNSSTAADTLVLERTLIDYGESGRHELPTVELQAPVTSYLDTDISSWEDGAAIGYRLTALKGTERSLPALLRTPAARPLSPESVTAVPMQGLIRVTYVNRSRIVRTMQISKKLSPSISGVTVRVAAPDAESLGVFDDVIPSFFASRPGIYQYSVTAGSDGFESAPANATALYLPTQPFGVSSQLTMLPPGLIASRSTGGWATAGGLQTAYTASVPFIPPPTAFLLAPGDDASAAFLLSAAATVLRPGVVLDSEGNPHSVYTEPIPGMTGSAAIVHVWHDGEAWQREEIARRPFLPRSRVDIGLDGTLHASWNSRSALETAKRVGGSWQIEDVAAALGSTRPVYGGFANHFLAGDESGNAHLFVTDFPDSSVGSGYYLFRDAYGWHVESRQNWFENVDDEIRLVCSPGRVLLAFRSSAEQTSGGPVVKVAERTAEGWSPDVVLGGFGGTRFSNRDLKFEAARSADGRLVAIAARTSDPEQPGALWIHSDNWTKAASWYDLGFDFALGFRADGKVWLVSGLQDVPPAAGAVQVVLYEQP
jgi:hypothetical protein